MRTTYSKSYRESLRRVRVWETRRRVHYAIIEELTKKYNERIKVYSKKIKLELRTLKRIEKREALVREIIYIVESFMSTDIKYKKYRGRPASNEITGRNLVFKLSLDRKISPDIISEVMKCGRRTVVAGRNLFQKLLQDDPETIKLWGDFKQYTVGYKFGITSNSD